MRLIVDENVSPRVVAKLRSAGHDVFSVAEHLKSLDDAGVLRYAQREQRVLITKDKGFGALVFTRQMSHHGIVLLRLTDERAENTIHVLRRALLAYAREKRSVFLVADENSIRVTEHV